jgi:hypothetical protein
LLFVICYCCGVGVDVVIDCRSCCYCMVVVDVVVNVVMIEVAFFLHRLLLLQGGREKPICVHPQG